MNSGTLGTVRRSVQSGPLIASLVTHEANASLPAHRHSEATLMMALGGDYRETLGGSTECMMPMAMMTKPPETIHANRVGPSGARSLLIVMDGSRMAEVEGALAVFTTQRVFALGPAASVALGIIGEIQRVDECSALSMEALAAELFSILTAESDIRGEPYDPSWLGRAREMIHETSVADLRLSDLSREVKRHGSLIARVFRRRYGISVGEYARRLRLARTARELALHPTRTLSRIALESGYFEHSHMTHDFRGRTGMTPSRWRELASAVESTACPPVSNRTSRARTVN